MAEDHSLPGIPRKGLVKKVKSVLWQYLRSRPDKNDRNWKIAWQWAYDCFQRDRMFAVGKQYSRTKWPSPSEIASQYIFLVMLEMRSSCQLKLPFEAKETLPLEVAKTMEFVASMKTSTRMDFTPQDLAWARIPNTFDKHLSRIKQGSLESDQAFDRLMLSGGAAAGDSDGTQDTAEHGHSPSEGSSGADDRSLRSG